MAAVMLIVNALQVSLVSTVKCYFPPQLDLVNPTLAKTTELVLEVQMEELCVFVGSSLRDHDVR